MNNNTKEEILDVKIIYDKRVLDPISDYYYDHYTINVSIDDNNYVCIFYYNDYFNFFLLPDDLRVFEHIILEVDYEFCTSYDDLKTLLLNTKNLPMLHREKIANMANIKWTSMNR